MPSCKLVNLPMVNIPRTLLHGSHLRDQTTIRHPLIQVTQRLVSKFLVYMVLLLIELPATTRQPPLHLPPIQPGDSSFDQYYPNSATAHLNAVFGREAKSPRQIRPVQNTGTADMPRGPIPRFKKLESAQNLQPRINSQPAYRRADPEGGFISVSSLFTGFLPFAHCLLAALTSADDSPTLYLSDM